MIRRYMLMILGLIVCGIYISGCSSHYASKSRVDNLEASVQQVQAKLETDSKQMTDQVKALRARIEGMYEGSIDALARMNKGLKTSSLTGSQALERAKAAEILAHKMSVDFQQSLANMEEKVKSVSLNKRDLDLLRREFKVTRVRYEEKSKDLSRSVSQLRNSLMEMAAFDSYQKASLNERGRLDETMPLSITGVRALKTSRISEGQIAYQVGEGDNLTLTVLAFQCRVPLWRLMVLNQIEPDVPLRGKEILLFGAKESYSRQGLFKAGQLRGQFGYLKLDVYRVCPGDNLWTISAKHQMNLRTLLRWNKIEDHDIIIPGDLLMIPRLTSTF